VAFLSDENFAFIAGYTEGGVPFGITHNEWDGVGGNHDKVQDYESVEEASITVPVEIAEKLRTFSGGQSVEGAIYSSIALSLIATNKITLERAAYLAECTFTDFIYFLQNNHIPWCIGVNDGHEQYPDLIKKIENMVKNQEIESRY
jgi:predicted HTH domain antitoxin